MKLRLFCALSVPGAVQSELLMASDVLKSALSPGSVSWVKAGNFHLTLSFLGDVEQLQVDELACRLRAACQDVSSFELFCEQLGCFPNPNRPRVIWAGAHSESSELSLLQRRVAAACAAEVEREDKIRFTGHITLGRVRLGSGPTPGSLVRAIERSRQTGFGHWRVNEVELICSDLSQGAPRYSVLHRFLLT